ncbi:MAG: hypothetical protein P8Z37_00350 [Acidobacteriota bacterium]
MFYFPDQDHRIHAELEILRSGKTNGANLCRHGNVSCVRCCLPHIGGDPYKEGTDRYIGPGGIRMLFRNFNPLNDPGINASQYEDSLPDVGREEMERRFTERKKLFLALFDPKHPRSTLNRYIQAVQSRERYSYKPQATSGPVSLFLGGSVPKSNFQKSELPECQLLGFVDPKGRVGCMAHPMAETSGGFDGRDLVGFFQHTGCCDSVGCEASKEFRHLSRSAMKIFDKAVDGMSWYEYSRHATSVLVYYLRGYDYIIQSLEKSEILDTLTLKQLVRFTNSLYDTWPLKKSDRTEYPGILTMDIPLAERITYLALNTGFSGDHGNQQLNQARKHIHTRMEQFASEI